MPGTIPQSFINDLIERVDIVDVIERRVPLKKTGKNHKGLCPFHDEKTPSFSVNPEKQFYYCFGCGASGTALTFVVEFDGLPFPEAVESLAAYAGVEVPREGQRSKPVDSGLFDVLDKASRLFQRALRDPAHSKAVDYLKARGLTGVVAKDYTVGFAPPGWDYLKLSLDRFGEETLINAGLLIRADSGRVYDRFRDRVMFPILDLRGRPIGFGGRVLDGGEPKYLNSPETDVFHKGRELYGLFEARRAHRQLNEVILVEGYMDVLALAQAGVTNAVATLGTAVGEDHFKKVFRYTKRVVCCFDGDRAGRQAAWKAALAAFPALTEGRELGFVFLPEGEDPDSIVLARGHNHFADLVKHATGVAEYFFAQVEDGLDLSQMDGRVRLVELALPQLELLPDGVMRSMLVEHLAKRAELDPRMIDARLRQARQPMPSRSASTPRVSETAIGRSLLAILLDDPTVARRIDDASAASILELLKHGRIFPQVFDYVRREKIDDSAIIMGRFVGDPSYDQLTQALAKPLELSIEGRTLEFVEGVARYVEEHDLRAKDALKELYENGSRENLERFHEVSQEKRSKIAPRKESDF